MHIFPVSMRHFERYDAHYILMSMSSLSKLHFSLRGYVFFEHKTPIQAEINLPSIFLYWRGGGARKGSVAHSSKCSLTCTTELLKRRLYRI